MFLSALAVGLRLCDSAARGIKVNEVHPPPFHSEMKEASLSGHSLCVVQVCACRRARRHLRTDKRLFFSFLWSQVWGLLLNLVCAPYEGLLNKLDLKYINGRILWIRWGMFCEVSGPFPMMCNKRKIREE